MKRLEEEVVIEDWRLQRYVFLPDPIPLRGAAVHFHGQGDYASRYGEPLKAFTDRGIAVVATDLPGHGRSPGKRGHVPGWDLVSEVAATGRERAQRLVPGHKPGLLAHSAGGLMALRELTTVPDKYSYSWISSPLVNPGAEQHRLLVILAPIIARLFPTLTVDTHVTPHQCIAADADDDLVRKYDDQHFHTRVSLGWGHEMIQAAERMRQAFRQSPPTLPLLITQGGSDPVCPPEHLRDLLDGLEVPTLRYHEFPAALHEPFAGAEGEAVASTIANWLDEFVVPTLG